MNKDNRVHWGFRGGDSGFGISADLHRDGDGARAPTAFHTAKSSSTKQWFKDPMENIINGLHEPWTTPHVKQINVKSNRGWNGRITAQLDMIHHLGEIKTKQNKRNKRNKNYLDQSCVVKSYAVDSCPCGHCAAFHDRPLTATMGVESGQMNHGLGQKQTSISLVFHRVAGVLLYAAVSLA